MYHLVCVNCGATYPADEILYNCKKCGHLLAVKYPLDEITITKAMWEKRPLSVWRYRELLPVQDRSHHAAGRRNSSLPLKKARAGDGS